MNQIREVANIVPAYRKNPALKFNQGDIVKITDVDALEEWEVSEDERFIVLEWTLHDGMDCPEYSLIHLKDEDETAWHPETTLELVHGVEDVMNAL